MIAPASALAPRASDVGAAPWFEVPRQPVVATAPTRVRLAVVPGFERATALARKWCAVDELPAHVQAFARSPFMSGTALVLLLMHWLRWRQRPPSSILQIAALAETNFVLALAQSELLSDPASSDARQLLGTFERGLRSLFRVERTARNMHRASLVEYLDQAQAQRGVCEAELALLEADASGASGSKDPLADLLGHAYAVGARVGVGTLERWRHAADEFAVDLARSQIALLRARQHYGSSPEATSAFLRRSDVYQARLARSPALSLADADWLGYVLDMQRRAIWAGDWDVLLQRRQGAGSRPSPTGSQPALRQGEPTPTPIAARLRDHLAMRGSGAALDIARQYHEPGGKLLRGRLTLAFAAMLGGAPERALGCAVGVEELHRASLFVDDFLDQSHMRHNRQTLWARHGSTRTFCVVRFLLQRAIGLLMRESVELSVLVNATVRRMLEGVRSESGLKAKPTWRRYSRMIDGKTASLFSLACAAGALTAGAPKRSCRRAAAIGRSLGMAFQMVDDSLDYFGTSAIGKPVGLDFESGVVTGPVLLFAERAPQQRQALRELFAAPTRRREAFVELQSQMLECDIPSLMRQRARAHVDEGLRRLSTFPAGAARSELEALFGQLLDRQA